MTINILLIVKNTDDVGWVTFLCSNGLYTSSGSMSMNGVSTKGIVEPACMVKVSEPSHLYLKKVYGSIFYMKVKQLRIFFNIIKLFNHNIQKLLLSLSVINKNIKIFIQIAILNLVINRK